jgi:hypothetical protein
MLSNRLHLASLLDYQLNATPDSLIPDVSGFETDACAVVNLAIKWVSVEMHGSVLFAIKLGIYLIAAL